MASKLMKKLLETSEYYMNRKDFRMHKIQNIIAIIKEIENNPGIKIDKLLSRLNVSEPFMNKKTGLGYLKDMENAEQININKETKEITLCD